MRGEICMGSDGAITQLRVYSSDLAARAALQDWSLDAASQWLLLGNSWFAIGPRAQIDSVSESSGQELIPTQTLPHLPPDFKPNPIDDCVQFVSSTANTFLTDRSSFDTDRASLDQVVPGVTSMIEILLHDPDTATLRSLSPDDLSFESEFSRLGPAIKTSCRDEQSDTE
ncbi:hypothetical protein [Herbiconiux sp.]|uniref:hypothetical protein n=1 Tax=Herbiconiux sp. TaxID=1871186 RepID=UPI0025BD7853|nr:hypothetical protein [Herbiconiux sp.]